MASQHLSCLLQIACKIREGLSGLAPLNNRLKGLRWRMRAKTNTFIHLFGIFWAAALILTCANSLLEDDHSPDEEENPS